MTMRLTESQIVGILQEAEAGIPVYGEFQFKQRPEVRRTLGNAIAIDNHPGVPAFDCFCLAEIVALRRLTNGGRGRSCSRR